jgi:hypothetical protein
MLVGELMIEERGGLGRGGREGEGGNVRGLASTASWYPGNPGWQNNNRVMAYLWEGAIVYRLDILTLGEVDVER